MEQASTTDEFRVELTDKAARVIREACASEEVSPDDAYIRIGALPGGCSGYKFTIDIADSDQVGEDDRIFVSNGLNLVVDRTCLTEVMGSVEVDFSDSNLVEQGFTFRPLRDAAQCGCGQSFAPIGKNKG